MTEKTKLFGFQPTGRSEDVPKPPKYNLNAEFWRTQWSEASGAHLMEYLRAEKLQEQLNTAKKHIEHVIGTIKHDGHLGTIQTDWILPDLEKALAAIGGAGCPVGAVGKNGLTKEEIEGSGDE
ncbi:hypothetical protein [Lactococcus lactis]|uniref:hypothetical protein n=1 Tax=Lactococcus lactis TaxID=1358 RepID=UPI002891C539|nr:hypothetical protein [Lactococcus lactis]MDT2857926.1 hypothetical protein [Lactococcus lactis]